MEPTLKSPQSSTTSPSWRKRHPLRSVVSMLALVVLAVGGFMMWSSNSTRAQEETPTVMVTISDNGFMPATITIKKGQDVTWVNRSDVAQELSGDRQEPPGFRTGEWLYPGDTYSYTFEKPGTFTYHDPSEIERKGIVNVE